MGFKTLPIVYNSKYNEIESLVGAHLEFPEEYIVNDEKYLLVINNFTTMEKYNEEMIATTGLLRIVFDQEFKIQLYEFQSNSHYELVSIEKTNINEFGITPQLSRILIVRLVLN